MEFKTDPHKRVYEKTREYLHTLFGEVNVKALDDTFTLQEGSTFVYVRTFPIGDKKAGVETLRVGRAAVSVSATAHPVAK